MGCTSLLSQDLSRLAPEVEEFMHNYIVDIKDVNEIMWHVSQVFLPFFRDSTFAKLKSERQIQ